MEAGRPKSTIWSIAAHRSASEEDVVHQDDAPMVHAGGDVGALEHGVVGDLAQVVTVEGDVHHPHGDVASRERREPGRQSAGQGLALGPDADDEESPRPLAGEDVVGHGGEKSLDAPGVSEHFLLGNHHSVRFSQGTARYNGQA